MTYRDNYFASANGDAYSNDVYAGDGWRFNAARSVIAATSDRVQLSGESRTRCPLHCSANTES